MGTNITGIGNANAIGFKSRVTGGAYFPPELKDALVGVWSAYGKSNDSTDRNIIKNKIKDKGGDFELLNFNYKEGSGYGKYEADFLNWSVGTSSVTVSSNKIEVIKESNMYKMYRYSSMTKNLPSFKVKISNLQKGYIRYYYREQTGIEAYIDFHQNGIYELPASYKVDEGGTGTNGGFNSNAAVLNVGVTIEQIPQFQGAVVTDGVDDKIVSQKTLAEMGITDKVTVVSMIHQISLNSTYNNGFTNYIENLDKSTYVRNNIYNTGKTGIYGYSASLTNRTASNIDNILGDKKDYGVEIINRQNTLNNTKFSVLGRASSTGEVSSLAWYWTFIANRVLTEDEINLVIEKYNLDRPGEIVKPQVYYNVKKQKITNDNHSAFDDKLIDYSGNGYDAKLYNFNWEGNSGVGINAHNFTEWLMPDAGKEYLKIESNKITVIKDIEDGFTMFYSSSREIAPYNIKISNLEGDNRITFKYYKVGNTGVSQISLGNTEYTTPTYTNRQTSIILYKINANTTIEIPALNEGALCFDGIDDYGKVTELPALKDYTVVADYQRLSLNGNEVLNAPILSKSKSVGTGAFLFNYRDTNGKQNTYSFGTNNGLANVDDLKREIYYQSKYINNGATINSGSGEDFDSMWIGTFRDNVSNYFNGAFYFAMLFPYSMSEFLIERQIEKVKGGTLHPNQVEFRPIIQEDENITRIDYFVVDSGVWKVLKPGDYVDVGVKIVLNVYTKLPYKIAGASSIAFTSMAVGPSTALNVWDVKGYIKDKTPQKIKLTLAVNEDIIQWNPTISANIPDSYDAVTEWFANGWETKIAVGDWIKKSDRIFFKLKLKEPLHEIGKVTFGGSECQVTKTSNWSESNNLWEIVAYSSVGDLLQVFNVQVDEYIRYEDIMQPYPILLGIRDENGNEVSWGGKLRVGSIATFTKNLSDSYLLRGMYNVESIWLNNENMIMVVAGRELGIEKKMEFKSVKKYLIDNNEPKCILSPRLLRIPNSSYKILGHIPDISGHGNHGKINNSAYAKESGVNGYIENFNDWRISKPPMTVEKTDSYVHISYIGTSYKTLPMFEYTNPKVIYGYTLTVEITGIPNDCTGKFIHVNTYTQEVTNGINTIKFQNDAGWFGFTFYREDGSIIGDCDITIKQISKYEGSFCFDGVDDFVTISNVTGGGKQILLKIDNNDNRLNRMLYDQRSLGINGSPNNDFALYTESGTVAYRARNSGKTYIDGILNENITCNDLLGISQNITIVNTDVVPNNGAIPYIGLGGVNKDLWAKMALYDFMLFDNISTDDKIKELNEYIGIEGNVFAINPNITIDVPNAIKNIKFYQGGEEINVNHLYLNKDTEFELYISFNEGKYAVDTITVDGIEITKDRVVGEYSIFKFTLNGSSEQKITIHSYEYIMYEDIPQPYPTFFHYNDKETKKDYSWGDKVKIGSIVNIRSVDNILRDLYTINAYVVNGESLGYSELVSKDITIDNNLTVSCSTTYKLNGSAPKCIFSPSKLKIPNSSYRYLGYIPDISGNGNNGVFNNFAFSGMSGANGYTYEYTNTSDFSVSSQYARTINSEKIEFFGYINRVTFYRKNPTYKGKIKIEGLTNAISSGKIQHFQIYTNSKTNTETFVFKTDGVYDIDVTGIGDATNVFFYILPANTSESGTLDKPIYIEQIGNYEGSICFDGIDDYVTIPALSHGGKQMLMKVNWSKNTFNEILYDQRENLDIHTFAIFNHDSNTVTGESVVAYNSKNNGNTYIDGILNSNIKASELKDIEHNITITNESVNTNNSISPTIGTNKNRDAHYAKMALYDFMLFDEVSTNEEIKQLNDIVGIKGNYVQRPPYYWDAYGKSNLDDTRGTIQQRGIAEAYSFSTFPNWKMSANSKSVEIVSRSDYSVTLRKLEENNDWDFSNGELIAMTAPTPIKFKANKDIGFIYDLHYQVKGSEQRGVLSKGVNMLANQELNFTINPVLQSDIEKYNMDTSKSNYLIYFKLKGNLEVGEEVTVEMLPVKGGRNSRLSNNNFAYDKMSGYGGYEFAKFDNTAEWNLVGNSTGIEVVSRNGYSCTFKRTGSSVWDFGNSASRKINKDLHINIKCDKSIKLKWQFKYKSTENPDREITVELVNESIGITPKSITLPHKTDEELTTLGAIESSVYYLIYFDATELPIGEEYTVEILPLYPNGLVLDGVDDYLRNENIPPLTDYTYIFKRELLGLDKNSGSASMYKGSFVPLGGRAFIADYYIKAGGATDGIYGFSFGTSVKSPTLLTDNIVYGTKTSVNGVSVSPSSHDSHKDDASLTLGKWDVNYKQMVFYKLMLYPRTTNMLTINMIKNMMAEDGIIDIQGKLFTDKFTGDFNLDFNKDFLIGN